MVTEPGASSQTSLVAGVILAARSSTHHGVVVLMANAEMGQLALGQRLVGTVYVIGHQHLVTRPEQRQRHRGNRGQAAGHQQALQTAFQRGQTLFQGIGRGRAMQTVGVAALVQPAALAHGLHILEVHGRGLVHGGCGPSKSVGAL
jgi:hypothetical protein